MSVVVAKNFQALKELSTFQDFFQLFTTQKPGVLSQLSHAARAHFLATLSQEKKSPILWLTPNEDSAERLFEDCRVFGLQPIHFPLRDDPEDENQELIDPFQIEAIDQIQKQKIPLVITSIRAFLQKTLSPQELKASRTELEVGKETDRELLTELLLSEGYHRVAMVERRGEFAPRGDILDIYPISGEPLRIELFDDIIESLRLFDRDTQRSTQTLQKTTLLPAKAESRGQFLNQHLSKQTTCFLEEPSQLHLHALEWSQTHWDGEWKDFLYLVQEFNHFLITNWQDPQEIAQKEKLPIFSFPYQAQNAFGGRVQEFLNQLPDLLKDQAIVQIFSQQGNRLRDLIRDRALYRDQSTPGFATAFEGQLSRGFRLHTESETLEVYSDKELTGAIAKRKRTRKADRASLLRLDELTPGSLVVHLQHGIGRYKGAKSLKVQGLQRDFIELEYANNDTLYVPVDQLNLVQKYNGLEHRDPKLSKMGGKEWSKTRAKVKKEAEKLAEHLIHIQAQREMAPGYAYSPDSTWVTEMEEAFPYTETPDQMRAISEVKKDMESNKPMDRLICGDVGYGKTEVAVRAAFKAASEGRQVAILAPTTVLAHQHFQTFNERLATFPTQIEILSRFRTTSQIKATLEELKNGNCDIVIGTHRLLSKDVQFKNLGMLIIDEEQRFGVKQKERFKQMRQSLDVLTLTATPIPRTLHMSMIDLRDLSVIATPPEDRIPIRTFLFGYHPDIIRAAILREVQREGQVFFVHNRVEGIERIAADIERMLPELRIAVAHGQMSEKQLEKIMLDYVNGEYDLLVCTTIIESGIDVGRANTIIINNAHQFGLSQLYQLRGRVGRSSRQAFCYLLHPPHRTLTDVAESRLETIRDFTHLGAGYQIALRDLEIRGAGDVLGAEQSGHIASVGFELYCSLIREAVAELKGQKGDEKTSHDQSSIIVELPLPAFIPDDYIEDANQKIVLYKKIANIRHEKQIQEVREELLDRFGAIPDTTENLLLIASLKLKAHQLSIPSIRVNKGRFTLLMPFFKPLTLAQQNRLYKEIGWKSVSEYPAHHFTGLFGIAAGSTKYPPAKELFEKAHHILNKMIQWEKDGLLVAQ